jgi:hypothetical protein
LRPLLVGLFALVLLVQAAAETRDGSAATTSRPAQTSARQHRQLTLDEQLARKLAAARKYRGTVRFFAAHRQLLSSGEQRDQALATLRVARTRLGQLERAIPRLRAAVARREARRLAALPPRKAICAVFGDDCSSAVEVAWCESRLDTGAQNGQYLGLFQMGSSARRLFGHGPTAHDQAVAAHKYFVVSGRDWSPWSCRWAAS